MTFRLLLNSREETLRLGKALGEHAKDGTVIALVGDLGAGKTTLTQGIAQGLGVSQHVVSPTFTLVQEYEGRLPLFHCDPYRLERPEDLLGFGFEEYFERKGVVVAEWANKISELLPDDLLAIRLSIAPAKNAPATAKKGGDDPENSPRDCEIEAFGEASAALLQAVKEALAS